MKCPKCENMYDRTVHDRCPVCGRATNEDLEKQDEISLNENQSLNEKAMVNEGVNYNPLNDTNNTNTNTKEKKKHSLAFYLIAAFIAFILFTLTFIGFSINSFLKITNETSNNLEVVKDVDTDENSVQIEQSTLNIFGDDNNLYNLDVSHIYKNTAEFNKDIEKLKIAISPAIEALSGKLNSKKNIKMAFQLYDEGYYITEKIYWYAQYQVSIDASNEDVQNLADQADSVIQAFTEATSYIWPELAKKDENTLKDILNYDGVSEKEYKRNLSQLIEMKNHILSTETEDALAMLTTFNSSPKNIWDKLSVLDTIFYVHRMDDGTLLDFSSDEKVDKYQKDPEINAQLFEYYTEMDRQNENALAEILMSEVQKNIAYSKIKKYDTFLDYSLSLDEVPSELYINLLNKIDANLDSLHRYQELENKMINENLLPTISDQFTMDKARSILSDSYKVFGDKYVTDFNYALDNNWLDLRPKEFKEDGAYTSGMKLVHPYIVMTYDGSLADLSTLTHEYGHMANYKYSQDAIDSSSWTPNSFTAEVPSTFNEAILSDYLRSKATSTDEKLAYLSNELTLINNTFFYQAMLAEFQYKIYVQVDSGNVMSADELNKLFGQLYIKYYGDSVRDFMFEETNSYWSHISHFYSGFYVYKYSTSLAIAYSVKEKISNDEISMDDYLTFLNDGSLVSSSDSLKNLNIDLKSDKWMDDFFKYYDTLVNEYEELLEIKESEL